MGYIHRDIEQKIIAASAEYSCVMLTGPRQVGKSTVLEHLGGETRRRVTLDDLQERQLAKRDPRMFLELHEPPILIDEVQYAPELFSAVKMAIDAGAPAGAFWLTGSQTFSLMELARESLAGRVALLQMTTLSQHEISGSGKSEPLRLELPLLKERAQTHEPADVAEIYERIWHGGMPGHVSGKFSDRETFYSSYLATYIARDVSEEVRGVDRLLFQDFVRAAACRAGQMLNVHAIAQDVGVSSSTAKSWLAVLEKSGVIFFLRPYSNNVLKRTVKTPKMYFFDTGLVAYLTRYSAPEILASGAINGAVLENYAVAEVRKGWLNDGRECPLWYYRDKDGNEIDLVMEIDGRLHPMEVKRAVNPGSEPTHAFRVLDRCELPCGTGAILCMHDELSAVDSDNLIVPIWMI